MLRYLLLITTLTIFIYPALLLAEENTVKEIEEILGTPDPQRKVRLEKQKERKRQDSLLPTTMDEEDIPDKDSIGMTGTKARLFFFWPNSFALRPIANKSLETEGSPTAGDWKKDRTPKRSFSPLSFISIFHTYYPQRDWTWGIRFSPSINWYTWKYPGHIRFLHLTYNAKALWNLKNDWGTFKASVGIGPMWIDGHYFGVEEKNEWTIAPRWQVGYYKFLGKRFFIQLKYTKHILLEKMFVSDNFSIENFSVTGLYFSWYFGKI